jgi:hypothetical protein
MDLPSPFKVPSVPGTPLYALSPERMNQRHLAQSPSLPNHLSSPDRKHHRNSSDVRSKVEFLNSLSGQNPPSSPTRQHAASTNAALQRAVLGREEAEAQLSLISAQLAESQSREHRIAERLESLMEELQNAKERQVHERQVFEKEVRKARKEAFKAGSATVKAQEELKEARQELKTAKAEAQHNQDEKEKARQEAFERAYALAGLMEEMEVVREKLKSAEKEKDTALVQLQANVAPKTSATAKSDAQVQTEPMASEARPNSSGNDSRPASRTEARARPESRSGRSEQLLPTGPTTSGPLIKWGLSVLPQEEEVGEEESLKTHSSKDLHNRLNDLKGELRWEKTQRQRADETIHMLQMECQFNACACRMAEARGEMFVHDHALDAKVRALTAERKRKGKEVLRPEPPKQARTSDTLNESLDTAVLEDMTRVIVDTNPRQQQFSFSTSSNSRFRATEPILQLEQPCFAQPEADLFDLSPPKQAPVRPSTAMGVMTLASPIRVVPDSPQPRPASGSPPSARKRSRTIALKEPISPLRHGARAHTRSPSFSAIPTPTTPGFRMPGNAVTRMQLQTQTISTTTTIPLRGLDSDDVISPHAPTPGTRTPGTPVSREAALAQIRARRDRARSVNLKSAAEKGNKTPGGAKRGLGAVIFDGQGRRDVSQASAPGRI